MVDGMDSENELIAQKCIFFLGPFVTLTSNLSQLFCDQRRGILAEFQSILDIVKGYWISIAESACAGSQEPPKRGLETAMIGLAVTERQLSFHEQWLLKSWAAGGNGAAAD